MIEKYREKLELKKEKDLSQKINLLKKVQEEEKKFMAFLMRKVVKTYGVDPTCDPDCTSKDKIIIFEGKEGGTYWTIKEYQEGTVTGEVDEI